METPVPVSCNKDRIGGCPLVAYVERGRITRIGTSPHAGPYMAGCIKGFQMARALYAPDRLRSPLLRTGPRGSGQFREITWPDALDIVAGRLGFGDAYPEGKDGEGWLRGFAAESEVPDHGEFRRTGIYWARDQGRVGLADFVADPAAHPLPTPSGRVELASQPYAAQTGFPAAPTCRILPPDARYPLRLVTPKPRLRVYSQAANIPWYLEHEPQVLWIHPLDAGPRGIVDGALALVASPEGRVRVPARVSEEIMPGVVSLLEGMWPSFDEEGIDTAGSANVLTSTEPTQPSQGSRTHSVLVQVCAG